LWQLHEHALDSLFRNVPNSFVACSDAIMFGTFFSQCIIVRVKLEPRIRDQFVLLRTFLVSFSSNRIAPLSSAEYGQVIRMLGNGRLEAQCFDGKKRLCHIRGKMRKKVWVNQVCFRTCFYPPWLIFGGWKNL
jgi:hypothetical protein